MLAEKIKSDITSALRANNDVAKSILRLVLSDAERLSPGIPDDAIVKTCRKIIESNSETIRLGGESQKLRREIELLRSYVPKESTLEEIQVYVDRISDQLVACASDGKAMGLLSKTLKDLGISVSSDTLKAAVNEIRKK